MAEPAPDAADPFDSGTSDGSDDLPPVPPLDSSAAASYGVSPGVSNGNKLQASPRPTVTTLDVVASSAYA
jgi:hypothetical protein